MTLDRYLLRELLVPFLLGVLGLTALFLMNQLVRLADLFVGRGVDGVAILQLLLVLLPPFLLVTLPAAVLLAGIAAFSRLSADGEWTAMRAAGISFGRVMWPVAAFSGLVAAAALTVGIVAEPWGQGKLKHLAMRTLQAHAGVAVTPGTFNRIFGGVVVYARTATDQRMEGLFISDERDDGHTLLVTAREGELVQFADPGQVGLHLTDGELYREVPGKPDNVQRVRFATYDLKLTLETGAAPPTAEEIRVELARRQAAGEPGGRYLQLALDRTRNVTFGVACLILGLLGPALGIGRERSGQTGGLLLGVGLILSYYVLLTAAQALVLNEWVPLAVGAWIPNGLFAALTLWVLTRTHAERPLWPFPALPQVWSATSPPP